MRPLLAALSLFAAAGACAAAGDPRLVRVWPEWFSADSFQSYHEYKTGQELVGKWVVLRSRPEERGGLYFVAKVENPGEAIRGTTFVLRVISPEGTDTRVFTFPAGVPTGTQVFQIGLTGRDWAGPRVFPIAWEVELQGADGKVITSMFSYLWERPDAGRAGAAR